MAEVGEYSGHQLFGPFTTSDKAKAFAEAQSRHYYDWDIEEGALVFDWQFRPKGTLIEDGKFKLVVRKDTWTFETNVYGANWTISWWPDDPVFDPAVH